MWGTDPLFTASPWPTHWLDFARIQRFWYTIFVGFLTKQVKAGKKNAICQLWSVRVKNFALREQPDRGRSRDGRAVFETLGKAFLDKDLPLQLAKNILRILASICLYLSTILQFWYHLFSITKQKCIPISTQNGLRNEFVGVQPKTLVIHCLSINRLEQELHLGVSSVILDLIILCSSNVPAL